MESWLRLMDTGRVSLDLGDEHMKRDILDLQHKSASWSHAVARIQLDSSFCVLTLYILYDGSTISDTIVDWRWGRSCRQRRHLVLGMRQS